MKKLVFATLMCVAAMSTKAQVLTSETVNNVYETVSNQPDSRFVYNVERSGSDITTMYVYKKAADNKGIETLKPQVKYQYTYAPDSTLSSRVAYRWNDSQASWSCTGRLDYSLFPGRYIAEYSRYNLAAGTFDEPVDMMVYTLIPDSTINFVSSYHRDRPTSRFLLISQVEVNDQPTLFAAK